MISGLKSDVSVIKDKLGDHGIAIGAIQGDIRALRSGYNQLNHEVTVLKQDVAVLKQDVAILKQDVAVLKTDMVFVKEQLTYLGVSMEELKHQMHLVLDALRPAKERAAQVDQVFSKVDDHEYRLDAVEPVIKETNF